MFPGTEQYDSFINDICEWPYWRRLWIAQEVVRVAKITVQCGTASIAWEDMSRGLQVLERGMPETGTSVTNLQWVLRLNQNRKQCHQTGCGLIQLLESFSESICLDPRDKVYGLLGFANDSGEGILVTTYRKTISQVFNVVITFYYHQSLEYEASKSGMSWKSLDIVRFAHLLHRSLFQGKLSYDQTKSKLEDEQS